jgi:hypothetical protein
MNDEHYFQQPLRFEKIPLIPHDERVSMITDALCIREEIINFYTSKQIKELISLLTNTKNH